MEIPQQLRESGLKATLPRLKVLELFQHCEERQMVFAKQQGFKLRDHSLSLYGLCNDCVARDHAHPNTNASKLQQSRLATRMTSKLPKHK